MQNWDTQEVGNYIFSRYRELTHWSDYGYPEERAGYFFKRAFIILQEKLGEEYKSHCENHALPECFETMDYLEFLNKRRILMAQIIKKAFERL